MTRALLLGLALLVGCDDGASTDDTDVVLNFTREAATDGGSFTVSYTPTPDPIPQSDNFTLSVTVSGTGADNTTLKWDAIMPAHGHGMNTDATVQPNGDGTFEVDGMQFHMPGRWRMMADVTSGETTETAYFDVECCE